MIDLESFDAEEFEARIAITEAAVDAYLESGEEFTLKQVARRTDFTVGEIFRYFPDRRSILEYYYTSLLIRYRLMVTEIEDFGEYSLGEKLSNLAYTTFEMMDEKEAFVRATYSELILCSFRKTDFEKEAEELFRRIFEEDELIPYSNTLLLNSWFYALLTKKYAGLLRFWLGDRSEEKQQTMELTDKITSLAEEVMYTATADRLADLLRFLAANSFFIDRIPFVKELASKIEIRS